MISLKFLLEHTSSIDDAINYCIENSSKYDEILIENDLDGSIQNTYQLFEFIDFYYNFKNTYNLLKNGSRENIQSS